MNPYLHLTSKALTDVGLKRKNNEDAWLTIPEHGVFAVADGMGGGDDGEWASAATVKAIETSLRAHPEGLKPAALRSKISLVKDAGNQACREIQQRMRKLGTKGTGSTLVAALFDAEKPSQAVMLHAGDSRAYRFHDGKLNQVTADHSAGAVVGKKEEDLPAFLRGVLTRAVGLSEGVDLEQDTVEVTAGDIFLLCSDGLTRMVPDNRIRAILREEKAAAPETLARQLIDEALKGGGKDNVTVIVIRVGVLPSPAAVEEFSADRTSRSQPTRTAPTKATSSTTGSGQPKMPTAPTDDGSIDDEAEIGVSAVPAAGHADTDPEAVEHVEEPESAQAAAEPVPPAPASATPAPMPAPSSVPSAGPRNRALGKKAGIGLAVVVAVGVAAWLASSTGKTHKATTAAPAAATERVRVRIDRQPGDSDPVPLAIFWEDSENQISQSVDGDEIKLPPGPQRFRFERPDYVPQQVQITLSRDATLRCGRWNPKPPLAGLLAAEAALATSNAASVKAWHDGLGANPETHLDADVHRQRLRRMLAPLAVAAATPRVAPTAPAVPPAAPHVATAAVVAVASTMRPPAPPEVPAAPSAPPVIQPTAPPPPPRLRLVPSAPLPEPMFRTMQTISGGSAVDLKWNGTAELVREVPAAPLTLRFERTGYEAVTQSLLPAVGTVTDVRPPAAGDWRKTAWLTALEQAEEQVRRQAYAALPETVTRLAAMPADAGAAFAARAAAVRASLRDWQSRSAADRIHAAMADGNWGDISAEIEQGSVPGVSEAEREIARRWIALWRSLADERTAAEALASCQAALHAWELAMGSNTAWAAALAPGASRSRQADALCRQLAAHAAAAHRRLRAYGELAAGAVSTQQGNGQPAYDAYLKAISLARKSIVSLHPPNSRKLSLDLVREAQAQLADVLASHAQAIDILDHTRVPPGMEQLAARLRGVDDFWREQFSVMSLNGWALIQDDAGGGSVLPNAKAVQSALGKALFAGGEPATDAAAWAAEGGLDRFQDFLKTFTAGR